METRALGRRILTVLCTVFLGAVLCCAGAGAEEYMTEGPVTRWDGTIPEGEAVENLLGELYYHVGIWADRTGDGHTVTIENNSTTGLDYTLTARFPGFADIEFDQVTADPGARYVIFYGADGAYEAHVYLPFNNSPYVQFFAKEGDPQRAMGTGVHSYTWHSTLPGAENRDPMDAWVGTWEDYENQATLDIMHQTGEEQMHVFFHMEPSADLDFHFSTTDYEIINYEAPGGIELYMNLQTGPGAALEFRMDAEEQAAKDYIAGFGADPFGRWYRFSTEYPPDLTLYGWRPDLGPDQENMPVPDPEPLAVDAGAPENTAPETPENTAPETSFSAKSLVFGRYEQDGNIANGMEPIEWDVLGVNEEEKKATLISHYILDARPYNSYKADMTWENCELRSWLNTVFLNTAFTADEQQAVLQGTTANKVGSDSYSIMFKNPFTTDPGNDTEDKVVVLSYYEVCFHYIAGSGSRAVPTQYARERGAYVDQNYLVDGSPAGAWWTRSPGRAQDEVLLINHNRKAQSAEMTLPGVGVRPVIRVDLSKLESSGADDMDAGEQPADGTEQQGDSGPENAPMTDEEAAVFAYLARYELQASSGAGAWEGTLKADPAGNFSGEYSDSDDDRVEAVSYTGTFGKAEKVTETTFLLTVTDAQTEKTPGTEETDEYGIRRVYTETLLPEGSQWLLTLPGTPLAAIPDMVQGEIFGTYLEEADPEQMITLTNLKDGWGFFSKVSGGETGGEDPVPEIEVTRRPDGTLHIIVRIHLIIEFEFDIPPTTEREVPFMDSTGQVGGTVIFGDDGTITVIIDRNSPVMADPAIGEYFRNHPDVKPSGRLPEGTPRTGGAQDDQTPFRIDDLTSENMTIIVDIYIHIILRGRGVSHPADGGEGWPYYWFTITNPQDRDIVFRLGTPGGRGQRGSVNGNPLRDLLIYRTDGTAVGETIVIPAGGTVELIFRPVGNGAGFRELADLIRVILRFYLTYDGTEDVINEYQMLLQDWEGSSRQPMEQTTSEPEPDAVTVPEPASASDTGMDSEPAPEPDPVTVPEPDAVTVPEPAPAPDTGTAPVPEDGTVSAGDSRTWLQPIDGKPGRLKIPAASISATSYIVSSENPSLFIPEHMTDGDETTCWQFTTQETPLGDAFIYVTFPGPSDLDELWIKNGFWKITNGYDQYLRNCRIRKMAIDFRYSGSDRYRDEQQVTLKDDRKRQDWTVIGLGGKKDVTGVRIRILQVYTGSKFKRDVAVSEIMFVQKEK